MLASKSLSEAARAAGVGESTLRRWLRNPFYLGEVREQSRQALEASLWMLTAFTGDAVQLLGGVVRGEVEATPGQQRAAASLLSSALRYSETIGLAQELEAIRQRLGMTDEI